MAVSASARRRLPIESEVLAEEPLHGAVGVELVLLVLEPVQELVAEGDRVVMAWEWSATHKGYLPGFPATGDRIRMSGATVYFVQDGRFTGHWQITDRLAVYTQLAGSTARAADG